MRSAPTFLFLLATLLLVSQSGCIRPLQRYGPPPPAYGCDSYGCDGYDAFGGYSACVDAGQNYSRRDLRRMRRAERQSARRGPTLNGLPVVAAYIVPIETMGGGWECCDPVCDGGYPVCEGGVCGDPSMGGIEGYPAGTGWETVPSETYPETYTPPPYEGSGQISPVPAPPAQEGPWTPPQSQPTPPLTVPESEPEASRPVENAAWLPPLP